MLAYYQELDEKSKPFSRVCGKYVSREYVAGGWIISAYQIDKNRRKQLSVVNEIHLKVPLIH